VRTAKRTVAPRIHRLTTRLSGGLRRGTIFDLLSTDREIGRYLPAGGEEGKTMSSENDSATSHLIGLVSDTHGLVRPELHTVLEGVELILHAGDVGGDDVLDELATIAPVEAVYGNTDAPGRPRLSQAIVRAVGEVRIHVSHGHELGSPTPARLLAAYPAEVLVYGHTHRPLVARAEGRLVINPGAAGPRRFDIEPSVALLTIDGDSVGARIVALAR
jgi:putative phosphoesterase